MACPREKITPWTISFKAFNNTYLDINLSFVCIIGWSHGTNHFSESTRLIVEKNSIVSQSVGPINGQNVSCEVRPTTI